MEEEPENVTEFIKNDMPNVTENAAKVDVTGREADVAGEPPRKRQDKHELQDNSPMSPTDDTKNPLLNPVVLQHLFQLCPVPILKSSRLVCKLWFEESLIPWRTTAPTTITMRDKDIFLGTGYLSEDDRIDHRRDYDDQVGRRLRESDLVGPRPQNPPAPLTQTPLKDFFEYIDEPENKYKTKPHRKINFDDCEFKLNPDDFCLIWKAIGSNITSMCLVGCTFNSIPEFRQIIYNCCPILQKLQITACDFQHPARPKLHQGQREEYEGPVYGEHKHLTSLTVDPDVTIAVSWLELFSHYTSLTSFEIYDEEWGGIREQEFETLIQAIKTIRRVDKKKLQFKHFEFKLSPELAISRDPATTRIFALAEEVALPLDHCRIKLHEDMDQCFLSRTLRYLAPTLKTINAELEKDKGSSLVQKGKTNQGQDQGAIPKWFGDFPFGIQLDKLTSFELTCEHLINLAFLRGLPNLEKLNLLNSERRGIQITSVRRISKADKEELAEFRMPRLTKFTFEFMVDDDDVQQFCDWMPNLTDLEMILNRRQTTKFIQNCKKLERVKALGREWIEEGASKITMSETRKIRITNRRPV